MLVLSATTTLLLANATVDDDATTATTTASTTTTTTTHDCTSNKHQQHHHHHHQQQLLNNSSQTYHVELPPIGYKLLGLVTLVGFVVSLVSNLIIIYLFSSTASLRKNPSTIIAVNLALSDLLYCLQWPFVVYCSFTQTTWILEYTLVDYMSQYADYKHYTLFVYVCYWIVPTVFILISYTVILVTFKRSSLSLRRLASNESRARNARSWRAVFSLADSVLLRKLNASAASSSRKHGVNCAHQGNANAAQLACIANDNNNNNNNNSAATALTRNWSDASARAHSLTLAAAAIARLNQSQCSDVSQLSSSTSTNATLSSCTSAPVTPVSPALENCRRFLFAWQSRLPANKRQRQQQQQQQQQQTSSPTTNANESHKCSFKSNISDTDCSLDDCVHSVRLTCCPSSTVASCRNACQRATNTTAAGNVTRLCSSRKPSFGEQAQPPNLTTSSSHHNASQAGAAPRPTSSQQLDARAMLQFRLAKMSVYLIVLWLVSWTPIASLGMMNSVFDCWSTSAAYVFIAGTMTKLGPTFDVFIYGISHPKIKSRFKQLICKMFMLNKQQTQQQQQQQQQHQHQHQHQMHANAHHYSCHAHCHARSMHHRHCQSVRKRNSFCQKRCQDELELAVKTNEANNTCANNTQPLASNESEASSCMAIKCIETTPTSSTYKHNEMTTNAAADCLNPSANVNSSNECRN